MVQLLSCVITKVYNERDLATNEPIHHSRVNEMPVRFASTRRVRYSLVIFDNWWASWNLKAARSLQGRGE